MIKIRTGLTSVIYLRRKGTYLRINIDKAKAIEKSITQRTKKDVRRTPLLSITAYKLVSILSTYLRSFITSNFDTIRRRMDSIAWKSGISLPLFFMRKITLAPVE